MNRDTRENIERIFDFMTSCVKPECLKEGWQTSGSLRMVRMAFNLFCNGMPSFIVPVPSCVTEMAALLASLAKTIK